MRHWQEKISIINIVDAQNMRIKHICVVCIVVRAESNLLLIIEEILSISGQYLNRYFI